MPEFHAEPYVYLAGLSHKSALIAWGAFYFRTRSNGAMKIVDDNDLQWVHPPRCDSIGCRSRPFGPASVEVRDDTGALVATALTNETNHVTISGLESDTRYSYFVNVKHERWASGLRWDWDPTTQAMVQSGGARGLGGSGAREVREAGSRGSGARDNQSSRAASENLGVRSCFLHECPISMTLKTSVQKTRSDPQHS